MFARRAVNGGHDSVFGPTIFVAIRSPAAGRIRRDSEGEAVKLVRISGIVASAALFALAAGCGSKSQKAGHGAESATPAPAAPTPDTTPIEALRTPAGMVLKLDAPTPTPAPAK